jgi:acyl-CoA thioester hydrolase
MEPGKSCNFRCTAPRRRAARRRKLKLMSAAFRHRIQVRYSECDQQGVVFYAHYLAWFDIAMTELFRAGGHPYGEMTAAGVDMVVAEAGLRYRGSARFDDEVELTAAPQRLGSTSMTTALGVARVEDSAQLVEGELRHVFVDLATMQKTPIPRRLRQALEPFLGEAAPLQR